MAVKERIIWLMQKQQGPLVFQRPLLFVADRSRP
jgi:hypothetical protein